MSTLWRAAGRRFVPVQAAGLRFEVPPRGRVARALAGLFCAVLVTWPFFSVVTAQRVAPSVVQVSALQGIINSVTARYVLRVIDRAERRNVEALVITLDTPGGFDTSMREIVQRLLRSSVPVIVYVAPAGARAGSAGVFITLAADVAAMAPGTNIGAAHPVAAGPAGAGGIQDPVMAAKVTNDAAAYARTLAQQRGRNAEWAERAVRESEALAASEALRVHVVDEVASDLPDLLTKLDGRTVRGPWGDRPLRTRGAVVEEWAMNPAERFLQVVVDPNIAYLLFTIGTYAIVAELYSPGAIVPAVIGSIFLLLAFVALGSLPVNWGGLGLLLLGIGLLIAEVKVASHGVLAAGGIVAFLLGSLFLFAPVGIEPLGEAVSLNLWLVLALATVTAALFGWIVRKGVAARRRPPLLGGPRAGELALVQSDVAPIGTVHVRSELWSAVAAGAPIRAGRVVRIVGRQGLHLQVEPVPAPVPPAAL